MALVVKDRVKEVTTTTGTSNLTLGGAVYGFQSFSIIGNGNTTYYGIYDSATGDWEVGVGTYSTTGPTLTRDTVLESSNSGSKVVFGAGSKDVFVTYPAERSVYLDAAGSAVTLLDIGTLGVSTANITTANITAGTITTVPTNNTDIVNKQYADAIASGIHFHEAVDYATTAALPACTYSNGASGVGATLTGDSNGALTVDGYTFTSPADNGMRILVKNQANGAHNGVYTLSQAGNTSPGAPFILTRATDFDSVGTGVDQIDEGDFFLVTSGSANLNTAWVQQTPPPITIGTTPIVFQQFAAPITYTAGTGLSESPSYTFNIANTGVTAATYGSASSVPVFAVNAQGQITSVTPTSISISAGAVSGLAPSATTDTTNASNITSGTLGSARLTGSYTGITGVGTLTAGTWTASTIGVAYGGTGITSYTVGDILYADGSTSLAKLADVATGNALLSGGVGTAPAWGKIGLQTHVDGTLQVTNGGTGATSLTGYVYGNGTGAFTASTSIPNSATTATSANTASAIVARDGSGNFSAGTITASLSGNASTATSATSATTATNLAGGTAGAIPYQSGSGTTLFSAAGTSGQYLQSNGTSAPSWSTLPTVGDGTLTLNTSGTGLSGSASFTANQSGNTTFTVTSNATSGNTGSTIVARDGSGNFSAGTITATLSGNASTATSATTASQIDGIEFRNGNSSNGVNPDTINDNGTGYTTSVSLFGQTDGALYSQAYSSSWVHQIFGDYRTGQLAVRGRNSGSLTAWRSVLDSGNYNSYAPTLTGGGASGTWSINITGSAGSAGSVDYNNLTNKTGGTGTYTTSGDYRAPIFYDSDNTGYYIDPASTSNTALRMRGGALFGPNTTWSAYLYVGTNGNVAGSATVCTTDGNIHIDASDGSHGIYLGYYTGDYTRIYGSTRSPIFYDLDNTGYYGDFASTSSFNRLNLVGFDSSGRNYSREWIEFPNYSGLYSPNNGAHFYPNNNSSYGSWATSGSRNSWGGIQDTYSAVNGIMYDGSGNGGAYREASGRWYFYYHLSNDCMGIGTSTTSSTYSLYLNKGVYAQSRIDATIYYDTNDTSYYMNPNSASSLHSATCWSTWYFRSNSNTSGSNPPLQAYSDNGSGAIMAFHRGGYYAVNFGLDSDNVLRIGGWSAAANLFQMDMSGNLTMAGNVTAHSDERLKKDWAELSDDFVERLAGVKAGTYTRIDSGERQAGSSAQGWQELLPEVVSEDAAGTLSLAYGNAAVVACVELAKSVVALRAEIKALRAH